MQWKRGTKEEVQGKEMPGRKALWEHEKWGDITHTNSELSASWHPLHPMPGLLVPRLGNAIQLTTAKKEEKGDFVHSCAKLES